MNRFPISGYNDWETGKAKEHMILTIQIIQINECKLNENDNVLMKIFAFIRML